MKNNTSGNITKNPNIQKVIFFALVILFLAVYVAADNFIITDPTVRLSAQLVTAAGFYIILSDIDIIDLKLTQIKQSDAGFVSRFIDENNNVQENLSAIMNGMPDNPTKKAAVEFVDLSTLDERLADKDNISLEYLSYNDK